MKRCVKNWLFVITFSFVFYSCTSNENLDLDDVNSTSVTDSTTNLILQWNDVWLNLDQHTTGMRPTVTSRALAYIHLSAYETIVHSLENHTSNINRFRRFNLDVSLRPAILDNNLALNAAYARVIDHFMINVQNNVDAQIENLRSKLFLEYSEGLDQSIVTSSVQWGNYVAERVIEFSRSDRDAENQLNEPQPLSYEPEVADGYWTYSDDAERALFPYWGTARTFVISSRESSSVAPPITYSSDINSAYYQQMKEVYEVNNRAKEQDNEELWIAEFWSDDVEGLMISPPGRQISIANQLIEQHNLSHQESIVMLLKLGFSLNDAAVSAWDDKYEYMVMRPNVYIHEFIDEDYQTNLYRFIFWPNPSFPGYPSGHSTFASAAAGVFIDQFGDNTVFTDRTHEGRTEFRGSPRQFSTLSEMAEENAYSRIPLGVHIRMDCDEGLRLGYEIADAVNRFDLSGTQ